MTLHLILQLIALLCFIIAALQIQRLARVNLVAAGLALWLISIIIGSK